jgi:hypothetical protein
MFGQIQFPLQPDYNPPMPLPEDGFAGRVPSLDVRLSVDRIPAFTGSARPDGSVEFVNQRWREYAGLSLQESQGWGWQAAIHIMTSIGNWCSRHGCRFSRKSRPAPRSNRSVPGRRLVNACLTAGAVPAADNRAALGQLYRRIFLLF